MSVRLPLSLTTSPSHPPCQYTYLATLSCLVCFGVAFTYLKFQEGALQWACVSALPSAPLGRSLEGPATDVDPCLTLDLHAKFS